MVDYIANWQKNIPPNGRYSVDDAHFFLGLSIGELIINVPCNINIDYADYKYVFGKSKYVFISSAINKDCSVAVKEAVDKVLDSNRSYARILALAVVPKDCLLSSFNGLKLFNDSEVLYGITLNESNNESYAILVCAETEKATSKGVFLAGGLASV